MDVWKVGHGDVEYNNIVEEPGKGGEATYGGEGNRTNILEQATFMWQNERLLLSTLLKPAMSCMQKKRAVS